MARPRLSDLRESGSIEQDADVVVFIHRPDYYRKEDPDYEPNNRARLLLSKQRNGPVGAVDLLFRPQYAEFRSMARSDDEFYAF